MINSKIIKIFGSSLIIFLMVFFGISSSYQIVFSKILDSYFSILTVFGATTIAFANYLDNVLKEIPNEVKDSNFEKYEEFVLSIIDLKNELIENVLLLISLVIVNLVLAGFLDWNQVSKIFILETTSNIVNSIRLSLFIVAIYTVYSQIQSFKIANNYKKIMLLQISNREDEKPKC